MNLPETKPDLESKSPLGGYGNHLCVGCGCPRQDEDGCNRVAENCSDGGCRCHQ
jgi:hypothetical protein